MCKEERQIYLEKVQKYEVEMESNRIKLESKVDELEASEREYHKL